MFSSFYLSWDWLRFACSSLFGVPLQEISNHLRRLFCFSFISLVGGSLSLRFGIGFALLAHPCLVFLCKKSATTFGGCSAFRLYPSSAVVFLLGSGLASLCSPIPVWCSFARNQQPPSVVVLLFVFFFLWSRDWLRFARPSLIGVPLLEISNHLRCSHLILFYMSTGK